MQRHFTNSFWASTFLILILLTACKNSTSLEQADLEITSKTSFSVDENRTTVATITATSDSDNLSFSITGGADQNHFSIDESGGTLRFIEAPDFETPSDANADNTYELTIDASVNGTRASHDVSVSVTDVNEEQAPTITSDASFSVDENTTEVDTVTASDPNEDAITFSITGGADQDLFSMDESSGALTFSSAPDFEAPADADANNAYQVEVSASDGQHTVSQSLTVSVTDVTEDQVLTITSSTSFSLDEGTTAVGTITASYPDGNTVTFSITGGADQDLFSMDESSGALTFSSAPDFEAPADADANNAYQVEVSASDGQHTVSQSLTVSVTDVAENQAPSITSNASFSMEENTTAAGTVIASDPDGDAITYSITGGIDQSELSIGANSGDLTFNSAPDYENPTDANTDNVYEVQVQVSDGDKTATQNLSITVTDVNENEAPSFTSVSSVGVEENTTAVHTITASDPDGDAITFSLSDGADANKFSIGANSGDLTFNSAPDYENPTDANTDNVYEVQVQVSDGDKTATQNFRANIYDDPDESSPPQIIK